MTCRRRPYLPHRTSLLLTLLATLFCSLAVEAQPVTIPRFEFSFSNPGARSLGFGGAFVALADDATAAYANPAGLVQLTEEEVSLETRLWSRSPSYLSGGRVAGPATGVGLDTTDSFLFDRDSSEDVGPSFVSVVIPRGRWSFALYGHQLAKFEQEADSQGFFFPDDEQTSGTGRFPATRERVDLEVTSFGAAAGWRVNDRWSLGLGLVLSDVSLATSSSAFAPDDGTVAAQFGEISFQPGRRLSTATVEADGTEISVSAGLLWRPSDQLSAGLVYRQGPEADGRAIFETGPAAPFPGRFDNAARFEIPDLAGIGAAYRSRDGKITVAAEIDRVFYSNLVRLFDEDGLVIEGREYRDAWEYHLGAEYALLRRTPILALRAGIWLEDNGQDLVDETVTHYSVGLGLAAETVQVDLAADFSDEGDTASLSLIYRF